MKTFTVPARAKTLNALLKKARRRSVILESADGQRFVLASINDWEGFEVGHSRNFAEEVKRTGQNKKLLTVLAARRSGDKGIPLKEVKRRLAIE